MIYSAAESSSKLITFFIVRENAADELGELDKVEAIPHLHPLTQDSHPHVRQAAQTAIEILSCLSVV